MGITGGGENEYGFDTLHCYDYLIPSNEFLERVTQNPQLPFFLSLFSGNRRPRTTLKSFIFVYNKLCKMIDIIVTHLGEGSYITPIKFAGKHP